MIGDVTFGQYIPTNSVIHKCDPRTKLLLLITFIVFLFLANNYISIGLLGVLLFTLIGVSKIPLKMYIKNVKKILPIILITTVLNALYIKSGAVVCSFWIIQITTGGINRAVYMTIRIIMLILASAMLSYSTSPTSLTGAIESLLKPLKFIGLGPAVHVLAMTMTIALRFIPTLIEETGKIMNAQKARGADLESGNLIKRVRALIPIFVPLLISSIHRAYELAEAMECRCYNGGQGRTKYKIMKYKIRDFIAFGIFIAVCSSVVVLRFFNIPLGF